MGLILTFCTKSGQFQTILGHMTLVKKRFSLVLGDLEQFLGLFERFDRYFVLYLISQG